MRHRILLQTNPCWLRTGLAENARVLLSYLYKTGRYDVAHYCTQGTPTNHPNLVFTPWKSFGCIPPDQNLINQLNSDPGLARDASYGSVNIDAVIKEWKPTVWIGSDDIWSLPLAHYADKPWFKGINSIHHITVDSVPVLDQAYEQAKRSKVFFTWAKFAAREMKRVGGAAMSHVDSIYGAMDTQMFSPISEAERTDLRKRFGIPAETTVFLFVFRNQLRKSANRALEAFARFKKEHPHIRAALHFHTSFSEKSMGWDLPKMAGYYGVKPEELLCTYVCKTCGAWYVGPYRNEDLKCGGCGTDKSVITANIVNGVPGNQMRYIYGISDACLSLFTSGGQEYHSVQSLLCGKTLACTNYSCGEDFCIPETDTFVTPIKWHSYDEPGTNFVKAANDVGAIASFMRFFVRQPRTAIQAAGERGRDWAVKTFGIEAIGAQWEKLFDSMPMPDWATIDITKAPKKNDIFPIPDATLSDTDFVQALYKGALLMDERLDGEGQKHWEEKLKGGMPRQQIHAFFIQVAQQENQKNGHGGSAVQVDFASLLDDTGKKRGLFVIKESIGDVAMCTALFESWHRQHPNSDLYVATSPQYFELLAGNEHVHKVLPYIPAMEQELAMIGQGKGPRLFDYYYHTAVQSQRLLTYLSNPEPAFDLNLSPEVIGIGDPPVLYNPESPVGRIPQANISVPQS